MSGNPWFVRRGSGLFTSISPAGPMGWLVSALYSVTVVVLALLVDRYPAHWLTWGSLIVSATVMYTVAVWRLSIRVEGKRRC